MLGESEVLFSDGSKGKDYVWETDTYVRDWGGFYKKEAFDKNLRPIRDPGDDAQDETLKWLDVPSKIEA